MTHYGQYIKCDSLDSARRIFRYESQHTAGNVILFRMAKEVEIRKLLVRSGTQTIGCVATHSGAVP